ncbi:MAG: hypothetical protein DMG62_20330 [Acidobacteria bacterium]|nr:MAG: hypothetical protein DMG63_14690 [Acidobacteriota bacterium]PYY21116.1 MAG: hypothetical protein DMG62_20330 [Acidobacteriota bacterium]
MGERRYALVVALLLFWTAAPALRCVLPGESLTPEEQACCKTMGGDCGDMGNHSCCKKIKADTQPAVVTSQANAPHFVTLATPATSSAGVAMPALQLADVAAVAPSPPLPTVSAAVLRI